MCLKTIKKVVKVVTVTGLLIGATLIAGCSNALEIENTELSELVLQQKTTNLDLTDEIEGLQNQLNSLNNNNLEQIDEMSTKLKGLEEQKVRDDLIIADYKEELENQEIVSGETTQMFISDDFEISEDIEKVITSRQLNKLADYEIRFKSNEYTIRNNLELEGLYFDNDGQDYLDNMFLEIYPESIRYNVVFDNDIPLDEVTRERPLEIELLGRDVRISSFSEDEIEFLYGTDYFIKEEDVLEFEGRQILFEIIGETSEESFVFVRIGNEYEKIYQGDVGILDDLEISVNEVLLNSYPGIDYAEITIGETVYETYDSGDNFYDSDEWIIELNDNGVSIVYDETRNSDDDDDEFKALSLGDTLYLPFNHFALSFIETNEPVYEDYTLRFKSLDVVEDNSREDVVELRGEFEFGMESASKLFVFDNDVYFKNSDSDYENITDTIYLENSDVELVIDGNDITLEDFEVVMNAETKNISFDGDSSDDNFMTNYGIKVMSPEDNKDDEKVILSIPEEQIKMVYSVE